MADNNENQDIIGDLHGDENSVEEAMGHDPKNAEAQAVAAVDKAVKLQLLVKNVR